jgi:hypothetical protein
MLRGWRGALQLAALAGNALQLVALAGNALQLAMLAGNALQLAVLLRRWLATLQLTTPATG